MYPISYHVLVGFWRAGEPGQLAGIRYCTVEDTIRCATNIPTECG